ncbi:DUF2029 domain-containing protein [Kineococcus sp. R8]|uniref:DUF2029 domain-containing protein n=1 Tax=Kineococcus siccus TaxID=2696567 RepID=UPI001412D884|nr:DUF2029 domain-containing protein [Kineococcus siccus]NAZ84140.1 DUF2029 domain-containing protein [Kineococcus siccus]
MTDHRDDLPGDLPGDPPGDTVRTSDDDWFLRAAARVGDLASPFYREERQRDVWNEASAVGLQLVLWLGTAAAAAMVWIGGRAALPYALTMFAVVGVVSGVTLSYARRLGVDVEAPARVFTPRLVPYLLLLAAFLLGLVHAVPGTLPNSFLVGAAAGTGFAVAALLVSARARRRSATP